MFVSSFFCYAQMDCIRSGIRTIIEGKNLELGFALYDLQSGDTLLFNGQKRYPMQSVYKFPIAMAALNKADQGVISLTDSVFVSAAMLDNKLWSPIREKYPQGNVRLPLTEVIMYTVALSDNNGSDLLLSLAGGPLAADSFICRTGVSNIRIRNYEKEMQGDWNSQFANYATPEDMIKLLISFNEKRILKDATHDFLWNVMKNTSTGSFKKMLPANVEVVRKTGNSGFNAEGLSAATNDVGIIIMEDGHRLAYTIFVSNSTESEETNYSVIANIAKVIYDCYQKM